jgi:hypothetical protein
MRTRNGLERLAAAGWPLRSLADSLVDAQEEDRILARIVASDRQTAVVHRSRRNALALAGAAIVAATVAVVATGILNRGSAPAAKTGGHQHVALTGPTIQLAGYHFRTPAGFKASDTSCETPSSGSGPTPVLNGFAAAASAEGGCVEAALLIRAAAAPTGADPVDVGRYQGFYVSPDSSGESTLYVKLPNATGDGQPAYLVLYANGLGEAQLVAVAESGLPALPLRPTTTTG